MRKRKLQVLEVYKATQPQQTLQYFHTYRDKRCELINKTTFNVKVFSIEH